MIKQISISPGVYCLWSYARSRAVYVGSTNNLRRRKHTHKYASTKGRYTSHTLAEHCNIYGSTDLSFVPLIFCEESELTDIESELIETLRTHQRHGGYNIRENVNTNLGIKAYKPSWNIGMSMTDGHKQRIREATKTALASPEIRAKMSLVKKGKPGSRRGVVTGKPSHRIKAIRSINLATGEEITYQSLKLASDSLNIKVSDISTVARGRQKSAGGYTFKYLSHES